MSKPVVLIPTGSKYADLNHLLEEVKKERIAFAEQQEYVIVSQEKLVEVSSIR
jgi:hypothetical protein